ncbi:sigma-S stabilization anti-adapter protein IraP [Acerihabitans sp. TG2]|uniref:sigma-S stabilization anti-adapter protein IraP n=1 Tax=Acerihabitans sp. TG2 TaxID=3096008 RepID=UPI002B239DC2|nr:sigma-S stabilization anti-adapter protein IraP [Acerihabitans sp. TG2]MEA9393272.1 sigma-S stabilization anti-adapter protein IraP [Acerihabitans sp. TG2]
MNNLLSQLLITLAQKEASEKDLHAMVESLEIVVAALISSLGREKTTEIVGLVDTALQEMRQRSDVSYRADIDLLSNNIARITGVAKRR